MTTTTRFLFGRVLLLGAVFVVLGGVLASDELRAASAKVKAAQKALITLGYDPGVADGAWGKASRSALNQFQKAYGFKVTRSLGSGMAEALGLVASGAKLVEVLGDKVVGKTLIGDAGWRVYYSPDGVKTIKFKNGKKLKKNWRKKSDGTYCEYSFLAKKELCGDKLGAGIVILKAEDKWFYFATNGKKKFAHKMVDGEQL